MCAPSRITRDARFHDLRHTFASHLLMGTWTSAPLPAAEVRALMRHGSIAMTERYAHLAPEHLHARIAGSPSPRPAAPPPAPVEVPEAPTPSPAPTAPAEALPAVGNCPGSGCPRRGGDRHETPSFLRWVVWGSNPRPTD